MCELHGHVLWLCSLYHARQHIQAAFAFFRYIVGQRSAQLTGAHRFVRAPKQAGWIRKHSLELVIVQIEFTARQRQRGRNVVRRKLRVRCPGVSLGSGGCFKLERRKVAQLQPVKALHPVLPAHLKALFQRLKEIGLGHECGGLVNVYCRVFCLL